MDVCTSLRACAATGRPSHVSHVHRHGDHEEVCDIELQPVEDARGDLPEAEYEQDGIVTAAGMERLRVFLTEVPAATGKAWDGSLPLAPARLAELVALLHRGRISGEAAKRVDPERLEWIDVGGGRAESGEAEFGRRLAELHDTDAPCFGRTDGRTTGSLALPNDPSDSWVEFYAERRLRPLARLAGDRAALAPASIAALERIAARLDALGGPPQPPARLHGDLWAGNRIVDRSGRSWLIDPAAHGGHREFDLAMMRLFGGFGAEAFAAYDDEFPLADGWEQRVPLHQLAPLIVHAIKFGGGYVDTAAAAIRRYR